MSSFIDNKPLAAVIAASALTLGTMTPAVVPTVSATPAQSITWEACPSEVNEQGATCGRINVPMNYGNPGGPFGSVYDRCDTNARSLYWAARNKQAQPTP